ncbi:hypothetical protein ASG11_02435 [Sphingomonas sp. Leaf357]|uniref:hypothetical protein n=1 Tax=Sphingomonas sp. Leaf357 TaxID=1736350 RepID=UPI0007018A93|nr:hypothetical protein [Sphingomonas sp. Leaf357]KQS03256.1 hypothetical protein ASG11_02435 [Sphingomonas sp. Leaf357]
MQILRHFNILRAINDLRGFLAQEAPHKLAFLLLSVVLFGALLIGFTIDSHEEPVYHRDIVYVQQWPADRTNAQIIAQQKIDGPIEAKRAAEAAAREKETQEGFKRLDDKLKKLGI